jgi:predicted HTH transcriptional regulator
MLLWTMPIEEIEFRHIDEFLNMKLLENNRLDYKAAMPSELNKAIAAFANTFGGLLIIGVDEDKNTNEPIWPPTKTNHLQDFLPGLRENCSGSLRHLSSSFINSCQQAH